MAGNTVLDIGSHSIKAGTSHHFPYETSPDVIVSSQVRDEYGTLLRVSEAGEIREWDALDSLLDYVFYERIGWERGHEGTLLLCEALRVTRSERERMSHLLFERFGVEGVFVQDCAVLALYAVGRLTGCVLDCGYSKIDIAPVYEGQLRPQGIRRLPFGSCDQNRLLQESLQIDGTSASHLKEQCVTVAETEDAFDALEAGNEKMYSLPDGSAIAVNDKQGARLGEALFRPELFRHSSPGIAESVYNATYCQTDLPSKRQHLENIFLCGGASLIPNLPSRLMKETLCLLPTSYQPGFCTCPEYMPPKTQSCASWMGGAILSKVVTQNGHLAMKSDYEEIGPSVLHRKFHMAF